MNKTTRRISLIIFFVFCSLPNFLSANEQDDAKTAMYYLKGGVGARASSMGNSFVAVANDVSAVYWNPSELSNLDNSDIQFTAMYYMPSSNSSYLYGAVAQRMENDYGGIGIFWHNFTIGRLTSENRENVFGVSYGKNLLPVFSVGLNIKYYNQIVNKNNFNSFGIDIAGTINPFGTLFKLAGSITDLGAIVTTPTFRVGVSSPILYKIILASMDISKTLQKPFKFHTGLEIIPISNFYFIDNISTRIGLDNLDFSAGLGISINKYSIDYSYTNDQQTFSYTHKLSVTIFFK